MDPPESSVNRIGRTIWTVWGYLSGAVARYLRPEVTDEGNQGVHTRTDDTDLKSAVNKINREVTTDNSNNEGKKTSQIYSADVKCSPSNVRVQVASVRWENTDVAKDDNNDELHVHTTKKQTYHCVVWSTGTDTDNERRMVGAQVDKETDSSDEVQAEKAYANNECKESATAHELEEAGKIDQKHGDNEDKEERDQYHEVEKCAKNRKDEYKTDVMVQLEQDVEREKQINTVDHGETEHADEQLIEENENNLNQEGQEKTEDDEEQGLESEVQDLRKSEDSDNTDIVVQCEQDVEQEKQINMVDHVETEGIACFKDADEHLLEENKNNLDKEDQEKTENDEEQGFESEVQDLRKSEDPDNTDIVVQCEQDVEQENQINTVDQEETEGIVGFKYADEHLFNEIEEQIVDQKDQEKTENDENQGTESQLQDLLHLTKYSDEIANVYKNDVEEMMSETRGATEQNKENETVQNLEEIGQHEQNDGDNEDKEECDQNPEDEECAMESEDLDNADVIVQSELHGKNVEQEMQISMMDYAAKEGIGGFKHSDEHPIDEKEKQTVDQMDQEKTENDEEQGTESQVQDVRKSEDPDNTDIVVQCEQDVEHENQINNECKESVTAHELEETGKIEQKYGDNEDKEERDQNHEVEKCAKNRKDAYKTEVMVQFVQSIEQEKQINTADHGETEGIAGFKHADKHLIEENENNLDQEDQENDEEQGFESQVQDLQKSEDPDNADVMVQSELYGQDVEQDKLINLMDHGETGGFGGFKHSDEHPIDEKENNLDKEDQEKIENDEEQELESQVQDLRQSEDPDNTDIVVQCEQDVEQENQINTVDQEETEGIAGFKHADEHVFDETEEQIVDQKDQEKTENDEDQETESQVQDMLPQLGYLTKYSDEIAYNSKNDVEEMMSETRGATEQDKENETVQNLEEIGQLEQNDGDNEDEECDQNIEDEECAMESEDLDNTDVIVQSELHGQDVEQERQISMMDHGETGGFGGFKHSDEHPIDEKEKQTVDQMDQEKTENDEEQGTESQVQDVLPQQDYFPEEADGLAKPERLKAVEKYSDEIDEFSKEGLEEVLLETEQDEDTTESKQDTTKYEVMESVETLQRVSEELSEKKAPNVELKMTILVDEFFETVNTLEDTLLSDSKLDTSENTPEMGTGSSVVAIKTEGMVSDRIVFKFPGELRKGPETDLGCFEEIQTTLHDLQTLAEEQAEREAVVVCSVEHLETMKAVETKKDIETLIESLGSTESHAHQEIDKTTFSHKEHVELRTELIEETIDTKISSEVEEAEPTMKEDQSSVIRNVSLQSHELLEFKEGECKSSVGTMDRFNESSVSEIAGTAEIKHLAEEQTDVKPVLTRSLSPAVFLEETVHLQGVSERCTEEQEILEAALEYVEGITNQVLKDMLEREVNVVQETESLARPSTEETGDAEYKGPAQCVSADAFVLEEEGKSLGETMESKEEMEVETTSNEVLKQTTECETTETDGRRDQTQKVIAGETVLSSHEDLMEVSRSGMKRGFDQVSKDLAEVKAKGKFDLYLQAFEESSLDFTIQKSRIAVKNPLVRPPKDPRSLLFKVSVEPLVSQPSPRGQKIQVSIPSKGVTGFKLPGLGAGLPVLRKTDFGKKAREGGAAERTLQPQQESVAVTEDSVKQEQVPAKPKWTPPRHPGMGSPFMMAELKNKLKKPVEE
ncbi:putative leucine-rich repeat-containing protein DDB_G0290503 [Carassius carassius]|uniref:putative leucine-rich repeat-containing protein DDB_G0290503 n=1 Tax=Carassius carassius TaxID=217509 RepID=UPI0028685DF5|nr:putative leucine-rich repeat-containing protein DDB_G0290503 [Carassius carassius]